MCERSRFNTEISAFISFIAAFISSILAFMSPSSPSERRPPNNRENSAMVDLAVGSSGEVDQRPGLGAQRELPIVNCRTLTSALTVTGMPSGPRTCNGTGESVLKAANPSH